MSQANSHFSWEGLWLKIIKSRGVSLGSVVRALVLWPLSLVYRFGLAINGLLTSRSLSTQRASNKTVIVVGGMTLGGAGKTPFVALLVRELQKTGGKVGDRVGIVCSGYGRANKQQLLVKGASLMLRTVEETGDEPQELAEMFPEVCFAIGKSKQESLAALVADESVEVIVVDDGLQSRGLNPDLSIALINSQADRADFNLLPFGRLREPLKALKRADLVVFSKLDPEQPAPAAWIKAKVAAVYQGETLNSTTVLSLSQVHPGSIPTASHPESTQLAGPVLLVSGLADNSGFQKNATKMGVQSVGAIEFPDHFNYDAPSVDSIVKRLSETGAKAMVTSAKDWVKLKELLGEIPAWEVPVWVISVRAEPKEKERFANLITDALKRHSAESS